MTLLRCVTGGEMDVIAETIRPYQLTEVETTEAMHLIQARAMDTDHPFNAYHAAHAAAAKIVRERP